MERPGKNKKRILLNVLIALCVAGMVFCAIMFVIPLIEYSAGDQLYADLAKAEITPAAAPQVTLPPEATPTPKPQFQPDFETLKGINDDIPWCRDYLYS
jgi:hypothetical protein